MKQIIPFKKELLFKTKVSEITSISLEHTLTLKKDDLISGEFNITGDYKMTEGSINREKFQFKLPFDIALDSRYDISSIIIDIDNFYYEIVNNESLQVNIDVFVEGEKLKEEEPVISTTIENTNPLEDITIDERSSIEDESIKEDNIKEEINNKENETFNELIREIEPDIIKEKIQKIVIEDNNNIETGMNKNFNIFDGIDNTDTYMTYYVYIVKENDTIDSILAKYNTTKEELANYNTLENITPGTKLIIPSTTNE